MPKLDNLLIGRELSFKSYLEVERAFERNKFLLGKGVYSCNLPVFSNLVPSRRTTEGTICIRVPNWLVGQRMKLKLGSQDGGNHLRRGYLSDPINIPLPISNESRHLDVVRSNGIISEVDYGPST